MALNHYVNKVQRMLNGSPVTIMDISNDTVTPATLSRGITAHDATGEQITGTLVDPFVVNATKNDSTGLFEIDKTFADVNAAYYAGKTIVLNNSDLPASDYITDCDVNVDYGDYFYGLSCYFATTYTGTGWVKIEKYQLTSYGWQRMWEDTFIQPSGNLSLTSNTPSTDCSEYATVSVAIPFSTVTVSSSNPTGGSNGDIWLKTV